MKIRAKFTKQEYIKYISHLDLMRVFQRAFRRANIPVKYSEGFNPHPQFSLATALALGVSSDGEYMDVELDTYIEPEEFKQRLNIVLPNGIKILKAVFSDDKDSIVSLIRWATYIIGFSTKEKVTPEEITSEIDSFLSREELILTKEKKKGKKVTVKQHNVRERIKELFLLSNENDTIILKTTLMTGSQGNLKPEEVVELLKEYTEIKIEEDSLKLHRLELFVEKDGAASLPI
ncbi:TIGR03936 family radical SAM-associated protein [Proteiniborus sp. MB09-C3]|uniref:TIGR03936 family radical SAM-associated protein n=1 Tax=Proteiniborus sp. MB09-C3 TaxID=3050072 RepID=UPI002554F386|nr:TIGR03936 family radical SAM-associated protein [Proteiniborus sp. MB09-C3]WIV10608.1 TIGR03936 family radical SAM-associated protein [Proteiniborus sp. MB09-C3]